MDDLYDKSSKIKQNLSEMGKMLDKGWEDFASEPEIRVM